jgi:hypothetical protein
MRVKLEQMLSQPGAVDSDEVWNGGINKVWTALLAGAKLKKRLPMGIVVCVIESSTSPQSRSRLPDSFLFFSFLFIF